MNRYVSPRSARRRMKRLSICAWIETSRAATASSQTRNSGATASARAIPMRWRCPARELVRVTTLQRGIEADPQHHLVEPVVDLVPAPDSVNLRRLPDDPAHPLTRTQRGVGVLEDHLHLERVVLALASAHLRDVSPAKRDFTARGLVYAGDDTAQRGLAQPDSPTSPTTSPDSIDRSTPSTARTTSSRRSAPSLRAGAGDQIEAPDEVPGHAVQAHQRGGHRPLSG